MSAHKPCRYCLRLVRKTWAGAWTDADGFVNCAKFRRHWPDGEPPVEVAVSDVDVALTGAPECPMEGCAVNGPHYHRDTLDGEEVVRLPGAMGSADG